MKKVILTYFTFLFVIQSFSQSMNYDQLTDFLQKHVTESGKVNYSDIESSELNPFLNQFVETAPQNNWSQEEVLAYWINAYNLFTIKLIVDNYPIKSIKEIEQPWDKKFIPINNELLSLNHIEHKIIRKLGEPRIHFALVCAAVSCPKLFNKAFTPETLDEDLTSLTTEFLSNSSKNKITENNVEISKIFQWFTGDFKKENGSLIDFLNRHSEVQISKNAKIKYLEYNWDLNE